jgi:hypothetical protein
LNIVHFSDIRLEHCSNSAKALNMQILIVQFATTFVGDAAALVNGFGRIMTHSVMAPIERIANACDVAGVLQMRRARRSNRRSGGFGCLHFLSELT